MKANTGWDLCRSDDKSKFLEGRNTELIEKQVALEKALKDAKKALREQTAISKKLKAELEESIEVVNTRDSKVQALIIKIKTQEKEISRLTHALSKKSLQSTQPEADQPVKGNSKDQRLIKDLQKQLADKDCEISTLKGMIQQKDKKKAAYSSLSKFPRIDHDGDISAIADNMSPRGRVKEIV